MKSVDLYLAFSKILMYQMVLNQINLDSGLQIVITEWKFRVVFGLTPEFISKLRWIGKDFTLYKSQAIALNDNVGPEIDIAPHFFTVGW